MLHTSKLRGDSRIGFILPLKRLVAALSLAILLPVVASAYTVVLRNGRYVDIPASFNVTRAGITYEYAPGLYVTIQMTSIDISATERANNEPAGSLLSRASAVVIEASSASSPASVSSRDARRTLTDKDLEVARARRLASETLYERRRVELGLPSVEESRRRREAEARRLNEMDEAAQASEAGSEAYWRTRAEELRTEMAVTDAEINYLRSKLSETTAYLPTVAFTGLTPFPFASPVFGGIPGRRFPTVPTNVPGPLRVFPGRRPLSARIGFGGDPTRGQILLNNGNSYTGFSRRRVFTTPGVAVLPLPVYAPYSYNNSYDQGVLIARLHELEAERAGLQARWRLLEDEARRAGAPPGWLRP